MRSSLKATLISERLQGKEPSELIKHDPELRELELLSTLLGTVAKVEPLPSPDAQARMKQRVMETHRLVLEGERKREREPARRVQVRETQRLSYATLAVAATVAAILVVSSVLFTAPGKVAVPPSMGLAEEEAWVFATGMVEVRAPGGEWSQAEAPLVLAQGSSLRTPEDVRAEIAFGGENMVRLDYGSEADILAVSEKGISVQMRAGDGYFRARKGTPLRAFGGGLEMETLGTVFDLDLSGEDPELLALQDDVDVRAFEADEKPVLLGQGKMLDLPEQLGEGGLAAQMRDIPPERLQDEWLLWNRTIDDWRGLDTGVLAGVEPPVSATPEITPLGPPPPPPPPPSPPDDGGEEVLPSISLQGALQAGNVALTWELKDGTTQEFFIMRATGREPLYPQDVLTRMAGGARSFLDGGVKAGMSYTYRVACESGGRMVNSNAVVVTLPAVKPTISLSGRAVDGGAGMPVIDLSWHVEEDLQPDFYALVRAEMGGVPVYPPTGSMTLNQFESGDPDYFFRDNDLLMGYTYNYRVFAIKGGAIILDSNIFSIYVDTTVIMNTPR